jgi:hypothetical protein
MMLPSLPAFQPFEISSGKVRALFAQYRLAGCPIDCPRCQQTSVGMTVSNLPSIYRLHCIECGWRTPWFESVPGEDRLVLVHGLDPIMHGTV